MNELDGTLTDHARRWCTLKAATSRATNPDASARARRNDLVRFARAVLNHYGRPVEDGPMDLTELDALTAEDLTADAALAAISTVRRSVSATTAARTASTVRGFVRYLTRIGALPVDPLDVELFRVPVTDSQIPSISAADTDKLRAAVAMEGAGPHRARWPARDLVIVSLLADCGLRVGELCALRVRDLDLDVDQPILRVSRGTKGGRRRDVPVPRRLISAISSYLSERAEHLGPAGPEDLMVVRADGSGVNQQFIDRLLRRAATNAGVTLPEGAAAHALRHHYGAELALRGVPLPVIQQLMGHVDPRTTSVYTLVAAQALVGPLDDAGWL